MKQPPNAYLQANLTLDENHKFHFGLYVPNNLHKTIKIYQLTHQNKYKSTTVYRYYISINVCSPDQFY